MSDFIRNVEDKFSRVSAHVIIGFSGSLVHVCVSMTTVFRHSMIQSYMHNHSW